MGASYQPIAYGIHSCACFRTSDGLPYGIFKVLGSGSLTLSSEFNELFGGSSKVPWAVEAGNISTEWTLSVKTLDGFLFELFLGGDLTATTASASSVASDLENIKGTSVEKDTTGIGSISVTTEADAKDAVYIVEAVSATTVDVYALTDIDFTRGTDLSYVDEKLKITASPLTITTGTAVVVPNTGVSLTGGSGTIAMTVGDTARFRVTTPHAGVNSIKIGSATTTFPEHRQLCLGQKRANGDTFEIELFRVNGSGFPIPLSEGEFAIPELSMRLVRDEDEDAVGTVRLKRAA